MVKILINLMKKYFTSNISYNNRIQKCGEDLDNKNEDWGSN